MVLRRMIAVCGSKAVPTTLRQKLRFDTASRNDGSHGADGQNASGVAGHNDLLASGGISPLLVTSGLGYTEKPVHLQDCDDIVRSESGRALLTQP